MPNAAGGDVLRAVDVAVVQMTMIPSRSAMRAYRASLVP